MTGKDVPGKRHSTRKSVKAREGVYAQEMCGKRKRGSRVCQNLYSGPVDVKGYMPLTCDIYLGLVIHQIQ